MDLERKIYMNDRLAKLWNFRFDDKVNKSLRQKAMKGLAGFIIVMILFTVLSRAADSMTIATVDVVYSEKKSIDQSVSAEGVAVQNQEQAISTLSGIKVKDILVSKGQEVTVGDTLFTLDMDDVNEKILEAQYDIKKLELQIEDYQSTEAATDNENVIAGQRASQDYSNAVKNGNAAITDAYNEMLEAGQVLEDFRNGNSSEYTSQEDQVETALSNTVTEKEQLLADAIANQGSVAQDLVQKILDEKTKSEKALGRTLTAAENAAIETKVTREDQITQDQAETEVASAEAALQTAKDSLSQYQTDQQNSAQSDSTQTEETLQETYNSKVKAYNEAVQSANESKQAAKRAIEDANKETATTSSEESTQLDLELKQKALDKLNELVESGGIITAPSDGIIIQMDITTGNSTPDGVAVVMSDTSAGTRFVAQITKEQQKLLSRGDAVTITTLDNKTIENVTVDMMQTNEENKDLIDVTVLLPEDSLEIGTSATMNVSIVSAPYPVCVPIEAIRTEDNQNYVLVLTEVSTVLGTEYKAERIDITISKKNSKYAALAEGTLAGDQLVIYSSSKEIAEGDRVRVEAK